MSQTKPIPPDTTSDRVIVREITREQELDVLNPTSWPSGMVAAMGVRTIRPRTIPVFREVSRVVYCASWSLLKDWLSEDMELFPEDDNQTTVSILWTSQAMVGVRKNTRVAYFAGYDSLKLAEFFTKLERDFSESRRPRGRL